MKKHIPNIITLCNQMCGIIAAICAYEAEFRWTLLFVVLGALFDFCDGASARLLKVQSPMGKELDSLADMITFGLVPGLVAFRLLTPLALNCIYIPFLGFLITLFSALRLAKFNIDIRQTTSFLGLETPANTYPFSAAFSSRSHTAFISHTGIDRESRTAAIFTAESPSQSMRPTPLHHSPAGITALHKGSTTLSGGGLPCISDHLFTRPKTGTRGSRWNDSIIAAPRL